MNKKIAINCWVLRNKKLDGIGYFTIYSIAGIIKNNPEVHFQILCDTKFTENYFDFGNVTKHYIFPALRHPLLYIFYMEIIMPVFLKRHKPDLLVSMDGFLSLFSKIKQIPVIYDLNFEHNPQDVKLQNRIYFRFFFKKFARKATRIATISEFSKQDIVNFYSINKEIIDNVSCGINNNFKPLPIHLLEETRRQWSAGVPYFFFVGSMHQRKNINRLLEAFEIFKKNTSSNFKLLLAGTILWSKSEIEETYNKSVFKEDIIFTGRLSEGDLQKVLGASFALTFVPIFEGFGLPIVEAMQCEVPVICSNVTSMPEVGGDATLFVNPFDVASISKGMEQLYNNNELRASLIEKGKTQKQLFSWDRTAKLLWNSINLALRTK